MHHKGKRGEVCRSGQLVSPTNQCPDVKRPRRSNQSILKEINPEYSLERLTLELKLQYFGQMM